MRKLYIFGLIGLAAVIIGLAWAEQITLSTYYPAPYGVYRDFKVTRNATFATETDPATGELVGRVGIGTTNPQAKLDVSGDGSAIIVPRKSTAGDPAGVNGMIYYNTNSNKFRVYENGGWKNLAGGYTHSGAQVYNGVAPTAWTDLSLSAYVGNKRTLVLLKIVNPGNNITSEISFRTKGDNHFAMGFDAGATLYGGGSSAITLRGQTGFDYFGYLALETDDNGIVQWKTKAAGGIHVITLVGYVE